MNNDYTVSDHLLDRLSELGVGHIFGVPGDYTLQLLDHVIAHPAVAWTGCTNELNAGYAADGYARMRGIGAVMTTFGVGELSAINAIAGSYAEHVPVVHIVGSPSRGTQAAQRIVHHSLGDGVFTHFIGMHGTITCARAALTAHNAVAEIDRVLTAVRDQRLPGYLLLPADVGELPVERATAPLPAPTLDTDPEALAEFTEAARRLLATVAGTDDIAVLAGVLVHRLGGVDALQELVRNGALRYATSPWGKSVLDEETSNYLGIYAGAASEPPVRTAIESAGVLIVAGVEFTDLNSGFFSHRIARTRTIEMGATVASVGAATFNSVPMVAALRALSTLLADVARPPSPATITRTAASSEPDGPLTQESLWPTVARDLRPGDIVLADQGTSFYGMAPHQLPADVTFIGQPLWASIGYTLPALLGACLARPGRRGVLLIGDGAAQLTVQELSTVIHAGIDATVIVVDNDGYTVERAIHGPDERYNDIAHWDWTKLPAVFAASTSVRTSVATASGELAEELSAGRAAAGLTLVQAVVPRMDVPPLLDTIARAAGVANAQRAS